MCAIWILLLVDNERQFLLRKAEREPNNPDVCCMLAQIELHLAQEHRYKAAEFAKEIINRSPEEPYVGFMYLSKAMAGIHYDPRFNLRNELISMYKHHIDKYPKCADTYEWLISQLIADHRLTEAQQYCEKLCDHTDHYVTEVLKIKLAIARYEYSAARDMLQNLGANHPNNFTVWQWIGDFQTQMEDYSSAKESYRKSIALLETPRFVDPIVALALTCEMDGDIEGAIAARKLELEVSETDWKDTTGESVEVVRREIIRLEAFR